MTDVEERMGSEHSFSGPLHPYVDSDSLYSRRKQFYHGFYQNKNWASVLDHSLEPCSDGYDSLAIQAAMGEAFKQ